MLINEIINELTFAGSRCTKDCSGHKSGFRWAMRKGMNSCNSNSQSFSNGCRIAGAYQAKGLKVSPKVRDDKGRFYYHPKLR